MYVYILHMCVNRFSPSPTMHLIYTASAGTIDYFINWGYICM